MKFKFNLKLLVLLWAFLFLFISIFYIRGTYARYVTALNSNSFIDISRWLLKVNTQDITQTANFSSNLELTFNEGSTYIAENKITPASTGYAEVLIDYSSITLPFTYSLTFSSQSLDDLKFTGYSIDGTFYEYDNATITNNVTPDGVNTTQSLKLHFTWFDGTGETSNDIQDTTYSHNPENMKLNLDIEFTQLTS